MVILPDREDDIEAIRQMKHSRRRFQFSIRSLLIATTVVSIVVAVVVARHNRQQRRSALKARYHADGADIRLAEWSDDIRTVQTWFLGEIGVDRIVKEAPNLKELYIYRNCSDAVLEKVSQLKHLELLHIRDSLARGDRVNVTDQGLAHIAKVTSLKTLIIEDCDAVTDAGMSHLSTMPNLEELEIPYSSIGDEGVAHLAKIPRLRILGLNGTPMTDKSLTYLRSTPSLRVLRAGRRLTTGAARKFEEDAGVRVR